ncbi:MAG TPA: NPCBM/NEW2 domain-containing protein [Phycisphaerae bacterium]|nr:NPCBM/NEW2 domain-containing protein [Phycisphaerae bacterium]
MATCFRLLRPLRFLIISGCAIAASAMPARRVRALSVETFDDKSTAGTIVGIADNQLALKPKNVDAASIRIPLGDITVINLTWQDRQAYITPPPTPSTQPATGPAAAASSMKWRVDLASNDHVVASITDWSDTAITLALDNRLVLKVPVEQIRAVWCSVAYLVKTAKDLKISAEAQDIAFVEKDGEVKPVTGLAAGIDGGDLKFQFEGEARKIKLERLVGILLSQREIPTVKSLYSTFSLVNGDVLSGRIQSFSNGHFQLIPLASSDSSPIDISLGTISKIEFHNGRLVRLTDLTPASVSQSPYFDRLMPFQVNQSLTGGPLILPEGSVNNGIAVHSRCVLTYAIDSAFDRFKARIGFQQPEGKLGRAACRVVGDGNVLWEDQDLRGSSKSTPLDISVAGVKQLTLEVDYGKNQDVGDRVIWAEPRLIRPAAGN